MIDHVDRGPLIRRRGRGRRLPSAIGFRPGRCVSSRSAARVGLLTILVLLVGCQGGGSSSALPVCQDLRAAEAAFIEHLWLHNHSSLGRKATTVFVALPEGSDPDREFLDQLTGISAKVGPVSRARIDDDGTVRDPATGQRSLILRIISSRLAGQDKAEIRGGYQEASLSASRASYSLTCQRDRWQVTDVGPMMISGAQRPATVPASSG